MKLFDKDKMKHLVGIFAILMIIEIIVLIVVTNLQYNANSKLTNKKISEIIGMVEQKYPDVDEQKVIEILNSKTNADEQLLKYGIDVEEDEIVTGKQNAKIYYIMLDIAILTTFQLLVFTTFVIYLNYREKKINKITQYVKDINNKKYALKFENMTEGELSKLESELYKITIMLKEEAENSKNQKVKLAESIADISHQLKTPLTSISIMLENLNDDKNMNPEIRAEFIKEITKQIEWMKWLVISLLKFSKLDANAVKFKKEKIKITTLVDKIIQNMAIPLEIKNIQVIVNGNDEAILIGDFNWEAEAITNILKNCIEHTDENKKIYISYEENNLYTKITIKDEGNGISKKDLPHIFERFYKGNDSSSESYGIGLALSKSIIEKDQGMINCQSVINQGTIFEIKYAKK